MILLTLLGYLAAVVATAAIGYLIARMNPSTDPNERAHFVLAWVTVTALAYGLVATLAQVRGWR